MILLLYKAASVFASLWPSLKFAIIRFQKDALARVTEEGDREGEGGREGERGGGGTSWCLDP